MSTLGLELLWGNGAVESFPADTFKKEQTIKTLKVPLKDKAGEVTQRCTATVKGEKAILDYGGPHEAHNSSDDISVYIGKTKILFSDESRTKTTTVLWADEGSNNFKDWDISSSWASPEKLKEQFGPFQPPKTKAKSRALMVTRPDQAWMRSTLFNLYGRQCAVSGLGIEACLEAAHIVPFSEDGSSHPENGLLLRADIHALFDAHLLAIEPKHLTVLLEPKLRHVAKYRMYHGKPLLIAENNDYGPSRKALEYRYALSGATDWRK